jgi:histidinol-phosphate phosphatase family protein
MISDNAGRPTVRDVRAALARKSGEQPTVRELRPGVFFDRDGTIIKDTGYIKDPTLVELIPEAVNAVRRVNYAVRPVIVVTNQSGIARGLMTLADYEAVRNRLDDLLAERGVYINAEYFCPHHPDFTGPCECRKPGRALFDRAILENAVDAARSAFIGDRWHDIEPARYYGARGILVPSPATPAEEIERARREMVVAATLNEAVMAALTHR